jgi:ABC-type uncharacterized transport system permease subunit
MSKNSFSWKNMGFVLALTLLVGVGMYFVAWQFNDGKITRNVIGSLFLGMALPSLLIGGVMRLFRPNLQRYFAITAGICLSIGLFLILT